METLQAVRAMKGEVPRVANACATTVTAAQQTRTIHDPIVIEPAT
jgi:hypothetical protein